jgi:DNA-binding transcriptional MerR regulator
MTRYRISELAGPTGFSPSTLRYYEQVGLLSAARGRNGYRIYGDADVARLRFIARAKRLGLSLTRIRDLVSAWDDGQCEPVKDRLDEMLSARSRVTAERIGELITFDAELSDARRALAARTPQGRVMTTAAAQVSQPVRRASLGWLTRLGRRGWRARRLPAPWGPPTWRNGSANGRTCSARQRTGGRSAEA